MKLSLYQLQRAVELVHDDEFEKPQEVTRTWCIYNVEIEETNMEDVVCVTVGDTKTLINEDGTAQGLQP